MLDNNFPRVAPDKVSVLGSGHRHLSLNILYSASLHQINPTFYPGDISRHVFRVFRVSVADPDTENNQFFRE